MLLSLSGRFSELCLCSDTVAFLLLQFLCLRDDVLFVSARMDRQLHAEVERWLHELTLSSDREPSRGLLVQAKQDSQPLQRPRSVLASFGSMFGSSSAPAPAPVQQEMGPVILTQEQYFKLDPTANLAKVTREEAMALLKVNSSGVTEFFNRKGCSSLSQALGKEGINGETLSQLAPKYVEQLPVSLGEKLGLLAFMKRFGQLPSLASEVKSFGRAMTTPRSWKNLMWHLAVVFANVDVSSIVARSQNSLSAFLRRTTKSPILLSRSWAMFGLMEPLNRPGRWTSSRTVAWVGCVVGDVETSLFTLSPRTTLTSATCWMWMCNARFLNQRHSIQNARTKSQGIRRSWLSANLPSSLWPTPPQIKRQSCLLLQYLQKIRRR